MFFSEFCGLSRKDCFAYGPMLGCPPSEETLDPSGKEATPTDFIVHYLRDTDEDCVEGNVFTRSLH